MGIRSGDFRIVSVVSVEIFDRAVLSGMWIVAGDTPTAPREFARGLGNESSDDPVAALSELWINLRGTLDLARRGIASEIHTSRVDLGAVRDHRLVRDCQEFSRVPLQPSGAGWNWTVLKLEVDATLSA